MTLQEAMAAVKANPRDPDAWTALGDALARAGEAGKARDSYNRALALDPDHAGASYGLMVLDEPTTASEAPSLPPWLPPPPVTEQPRQGEQPRAAPAAAGQPSAVSQAGNLAGRGGRWWWRTFQAQGNLGKGVLGCSTLFLLCCICGVPLSVVAPPVTPTPRPIAAAPTQVAATASPIPASPTEAVAASPTSVPTETSSPEPTETPEPEESPVPTPEPTADPAEALYLIEVKGISEGYGEALESVSSLSTRMGQDTDLYFDETWRADMVAALRSLQDLGGQVRELKVPPRFREAHTHLLIAATHFDKSADLLAEGLDEVDASKIERAIIRMQLGGEEATKASEALKRTQGE